MRNRTPNCNEYAYLTSFRRRQGLFGVPSALQQRIGDGGFDIDFLQLRNLRGLEISLVCGHGFDTLRFQRIAE